MTPAELPAAVDALRQLLDEQDAQRASARAVRRLMPRPRSVAQMLARRPGSRLIFVLHLTAGVRRRVDLAQLPHPAGGPHPGGGTTAEGGR